MLDVYAGEFAAVFTVGRGEKRFGLDGHSVNHDSTATAQRVEASLENAGLGRPARR